ncbi:SGNH/GDSL hydrolase family protein, partial [Candidatus Saccharibacteria bacterium]|nr:SGNH/GDSL hydrolase family protein [Candidatus Saccharibacteria bacterium]
MCHLSQRSYPYLISSVLNYGQYESVACSGAVMEDVWNNSKEYRKENSQSKGLFEDIYDEQIYMSFLPGHRAQNEFNKQHGPNIITLSIGGNNIGFGDIVLRCMDTDTCYDNYEDRLMLADLINKQFGPLTNTYNEVKASTDPRSKIYIIGYPQLADTEGTCDMNVHLNKDERVFAKQLIGHLNSVIKKAAEYSGVFYVDVEDAFAGHKMCEARNSWEVAVNGLTAGNDQVDLPFVHGPIGNESFHPNALGHDLLKIKILEKTNNFTAQMPTPNPNAKATELDNNTPLLQAPKSNKTIRNLKYLTGTDGGVIRAGTFWAYKATGLDEVFAVGAEIKAWLHSEPLSLGTYSLGYDGSVGIGASIPATVAPGFHTLHLYGKNSSGEDIDVFKTVYVEGLALCSSGQDNDKDKLDDACDGFIDQPPTVVAPPTQPVTNLSVAPTTPDSTQEEPVFAETSQDSDDTRTTTTNDLNQPAVLGAKDEMQELPTANIATQTQQEIKSSNLWTYWPQALIIFIILTISLTIILAF